MKLKPFEDIRDRYIVVDFQNTLWKSWMVKHSGEEMKRKDGYPTGHVFRFFRTINKWKRDFGGQLVFCYEGGEKFRYELFPGYKAGRKRDHDFDPAPDVIKMLKYVKCTEYKPVDAEADDAIAAFVDRHKEAKILILSSDKDLWTLRGPHVQIVSFREVLDEAAVAKSCKKHYGCEQPASITLAKSLFGDKSDGLPNVPRLFKKHVASVLEVAETPDEFFSNMSSIPDKTVTKLMEHEDQIRKMYRVVMLRTDVKLKKREREGDADKLREYLRSFECHSLLHQVEFLTR